MKHFLPLLKLIRWPNLLMMALVLYMIRYAMLIPFGIDLALEHWQYALLVLSVLFTAAGGYVINDFFDQQVDSHNKPHRRTVGKVISEDLSVRIYGVFTALGILLGFYTGWEVGELKFGGLNAFAAFLLWMYSAQWKKMPFLGNFVVSLCSAGVLLYPALFDIWPALDEADNYENTTVMVYVILIYAGFAFYTSLIREIIKDIEDAEGDRKAGFRTLPLAWGINAARWLSWGMSLILAATLIGTAYYYVFRNDVFSGIYLALFVILPVIALLYRLSTAKTSRDYFICSTLTKVVMLFGILSPAVFTFSFFVIK